MSSQFDKPTKNINFLNYQKNRFLSSQKTIKDIFYQWNKELNPIDIELLIAYHIKKDRTFIISHPEHQLTFWQNKRVQSNLKKRQQNIPLAYLIGIKEFYGRDFTVNKNTLIPRPETELMIDIILKQITNEKIKSEKNKDYLILDIGTGSGNIIITLIKELEKIISINKQNLSKNYSTKFNFLASDISRSALKISQKNARKFNVLNKIIFFQSNLLQNKKLFNKIQKFQNEIIIIANLPYVNINFKNNLLKQKESKSLKFEPSLALWSNEDGLAHYNKLIQEIKTLKQKNSNHNFTIYFEINPEQKQLLSKKIKTIFPNAKINFQKDLANKTRICTWSI